MADWGHVDISRFSKDDAASSSYFTTITSSGSANTKGSYTTVVASLPFDISGFFMKLIYGSNFSILLDVSIGAAASEVVVLPDIPLEATIGIGGGGFFTSGMVYVPLRLPGGTRIAMRSQSNAGGSTTRVRMQLIAAAMSPGPGFSLVERAGSLPGSSQGQLVTAGASSAKGSWAQLTSSLAINGKHIVLFATGNTGSQAEFGIDIGVGGSGSEVVIMEDLYYSTNIGTGSIQVGYCESWSIPLAIPKGSALSLRANNNTGATLPLRCGMLVLG